MKICIKENEYNPSLLGQSWVTEEYVLENGYTIVEIDDKFADCKYEDFNNDFTFNEEKYNARKEELNKKSEKELIVSKIREKYSIDDELAILRQRDSKPEEFEEYNNYVEQCKTEVKSEENEEYNNYIEQCKDEVESEETKNDEINEDLVEEI